jgi:leucyl-tRNA synthetase
MSKSYGNVINPDEVVRDFGADTLRLFEMFMGPLEKTPKIWSTRGVEGIRRFLDRVARLLWEEEKIVLSSRLCKEEADEALDKLRHRTLKAVTEDLERLHFNTAISRMMELSNELTKRENRPRSVLESLVEMLGPFAPHLAEEMWEALGHEDRLVDRPWPVFDATKIEEEEIEIVVQINGKLRSRLRLAASSDREALEKAALADKKIREHLADKTIRKVVVVPGRMVNVVAG